MKKIFSRENIVTFVLVTLACATAIVVIVPLVRKFLPKKASTVTTASPATAS